MGRELPVLAPRFPRIAYRAVSRRRSFSHDVITEVSWISEIRHFPTVEIVFRHAVFDEAFELFGVAGRQRPPIVEQPDLLGGAAIVDLVKLVATAKLGAEAVPQQFHQL